MISIITPCKNVVRDGRMAFFKKMMLSLKEQTVQDFEHIVVDGGSEDGSLEMLGSYLGPGQIDVLISEGDQNLHEALNRGLRIAKGEYVHVMNSDNYFAVRDFFERSLDALKKFRVDYTHADRLIIRRDGGPSMIKRGDERVAFFRMPFRWQTMLMKKEIYDEFSPFDESYQIASDYKFMLKMILAGKRGYYFPEVLIHSLDGGITADRETCIREVTKVLYECYGKRYALSLDECQKIYLQKIDEKLLFKINTQITDERIRASLNFCFSQQMTS